MCATMTEPVTGLTTQETFEDDSIHYWMSVGRGAIQYGKATTLIEARSALLDLMSSYDDTDPVRVEAQLVVNEITNELVKRAGSQAKYLMTPIETCFGDIERYLEEGLFNAARHALLHSPMPKIRAELLSGASRTHVQAAIARISGKKFEQYMKDIDDACATKAQEIHDLERAFKATAHERALKRLEEERNKMRNAMKGHVKQPVIDETNDLIKRVEESIATGDRKRAGAMLANLRSKSKYGDAIRAIYGDAPETFLAALQTRVNAIERG